MYVCLYVCVDVCASACAFAYNWQALSHSHRRSMESKRVHLIKRASIPCDLEWYTPYRHLDPLLYVSYASGEERRNMDR